MPGLKLIQSNQLEVLSQALAATLSTPLSSPLTPEIVVVQSRGMQRWLSMELARMHGVCANVSWPFPNAFVLDMFSRVLAGQKQPPLFERDALALRIMDCLPGLLGHRDFERIRDYLEHDASGMKLYQFSSLMAGLYDQYLIFRPGVVLGWEGGGAASTYPENWQAALWRKVVDGREALHRARLRELFMQAIPHTDASLLPERVSVFGISYLPAFHLEVLRALSHKVDVGIYCLNPCREYWADIMPEHRIARVDAGDRHLESGNELLATLGRLGRNFLDMVLDLDPEQHDLFAEGTDSTMLGRVQGDILNLRAPGSEGVLGVQEGDRSIQVHSCHSPMREVEVLLDTLLDLFETLPGLEPKDVLVMAPDIEAYAPLIHAVFGMERDDPRYLPYSISDRSFRRSSRLADCLMAVLDLASARLEASLVMDLLDRETVRARFGMDEDAVAKVQAWVAGTGIRWAKDGRHKEELGLPGFEENTWEFGLRRLLLGYAMAGGKSLFAGIAPHDEVDPSSAELLGSFLDFVERLFAAVEALRQERGLAEWSGVLLDIIDGLMAADEDGAQDMLRLKAAVRGLERAGTEAGFAGRVGIGVVRHHLSRAFGSAAEGAGFLERGVTFCSMLPMRSIPFRVICLMGMNHEAFPRRDYASGLDLMALHGRKGDRSKRDDDLYLFLEALLSARDALSISYIGQGIQDNAPIPPSVVVSALLEYLEKAFASPEVVRKHSLQAFNAKYFTPGTNLFSYSRDNALAARALWAGPGAGQGWPALAGELEEQWRTVDPERLLEFFRCPARFFLRHRLGAELPRDEEPVLDREPFTLAGLERYSLQQRILAERLAGAGMGADLARLRAEGLLPHGVAGEMALQSLTREVDGFLPLIEKARAGRTFEKTPVSVGVDEFTVAGTVESLAGGSFLSFRYARTAPADLLRAWLSLLLLQAARPGGDATAIHIHREGVLTLRPPADPLRALRGLLDAYRQGLAKPVHFFPKSSLAYAESLKKYGSEERAMEDARGKWEGSAQERPEAGDPAAHLCFPRTDPLDGEFRALALTVFWPVLTAMEVP